MSKKNNTCKKYPKACKTLASGICSKRSSKGISQYKLSDNTDRTRNCIQQLECYEHLPTLETLFEVMVGLEFEENEGKEFLWGCLEAFREDKARQKEREKEPAGAV